MKNVEQRFRSRESHDQAADLKLVVMKTHTVLAIAMAVNPVNRLRYYFPQEADSSFHSNVTHDLNSQQSSTDSAANKTIVGPLNPGYTQQLPPSSYERVLTVYWKHAIQLSDVKIKPGQIDHKLIFDAFHLFRPIYIGCLRN